MKRIASFEGVEDSCGERLRLAPPQWINRTARWLAARPAPSRRNCAATNRQRY